MDNLKKNTYMMTATSKTAIRPFSLLAKQLHEIEGSDSIIICEKDVYASYHKEDVDKDSENYLFFISPNGDLYHDGAAGDKLVTNVVSKNQTDSAFKSTVNGIFKDGFIISVYRILWNVIMLLKEKRKVLNLLNLYKPKAVIMYSDRKSYFELAINKVAREKHISLYMAPVVNHNTKEELLQNPKNFIRVNKDEKKHFLYSVIEKKYPLYHCEYGNQDVYIYSGYTFWALAILKMLPPNPWIMGSNYFDKVGVISKKNYDYYIKSSEETNIQIDVTYMHSVEETEIIRQFKSRNELVSRLKKEYGLKDGPVVCYALTGYSETTINITREQVFKNYIIILEQILKVYSDVLISIHPRIPKCDIHYFEVIPNVHILEEPLYQIVGAVDVFIGFERSSTQEFIKYFSYPSVSITHEMFCSEFDDSMITRILELFKNTKRDVNKDVELYQDDRINFCEFLTGIKI